MLRTKTLLMTLLSLIIATKAMAYDAVVNGIYYLLSGTKATVTNDTGAAGSTCYDDKLLITVPETITVGGVVYTVTAVGADAFNGCQSEGVLTLPATIQTIGANAFKEADFDLIELNATTPIAYDQAWFGTDGFKTFFIPGGTKEAYMAAGWPSEGTTLLEKANYFIGSVGYVLHPSTHTATIACKMLDFMKALYGGTLPGFELGDVVVPETITEGGVDYTVTGIDVYAFPYCTMTSISLPNTITELGYGAFGMCTVPSISIPNSITSIVEGTFANAAIDDIHIPSSVTKIGDHAFVAFNGTIYCSAATPPVLEGSPFDNNSGIKLYVPEASVNSYKAAEGWRNILTILPFEMRSAFIIPSNGWPLGINHGDTSDSFSEPSIYKFEKGSNVVITPYNHQPYIYNLYLYVNGVDRTSDLIEEDGDKKLYLQKVEEDMLIEVKLEYKQLAVGICSNKGGIIKATFTAQAGNIKDQSTSFDGGGQLVDNIKPGTDITFTFIAQNGYELAMVFCECERSIGNNTDYEVQLQADGSYKFVLRANQIMNAKSSVTAIYKKTGSEINGDVNGDSKVTIADVTKLVNIILGKE